MILDMEPKVGDDTGMTNNKKFIASVVIAFAALMGTAAVAEARPPSYCGGAPALCTQPFPSVPSNKPMTVKERKALTAKATEAAHQIRHALGWDN